MCVCRGVGGGGGGDRVQASRVDQFGTRASLNRVWTQHDSNLDLMACACERRAQHKMSVVLETASCCALHILAGA